MGEINLICDHCYNEFYTVFVTNTDTKFPIEFRKIREAYLKHKKSDECRKVFPDFHELENDIRDGIL